MVAGRFVDEDLDLTLANRGLLGRLFRRFFRMIERSWQMYPLSILFGLGFDTATEVGLLGYGWAFGKPIRNLYYNLTITAVSVVVALIVGGLETLNLIGDRLGLADGDGFLGRHPVVER
jgi:nickel/cobalt transporter (NiCoT) family protein